MVKLSFLNIFNPCSRRDFVSIVIFLLLGTAFCNFYIYAVRSLCLISKEYVTNVLQGMIKNFATKGQYFMLVTN